MTKEDIKYIGEFNKCLARVQDFDGKWVFIDLSGKIVIPCQWVDTGYFSEGLATVKDSNGKWGFINKTGEVVLPFKWNDVALWVNENSMACVKDATSEKWFDIDKNGQEAPKFKQQ